MSGDTANLRQRAWCCVPGKGLNLSANKNASSLYYLGSGGKQLEPPPDSTIVPGSTTTTTNELLLRVAYSVDGIAGMLEDAETLSSLLMGQTTLLSAFVTAMRKAVPGLSAAVGMQVVGVTAVAGGRRRTSSSSALGAEILRIELDFVDNFSLVAEWTAQEQLLRGTDSDRSSGRSPSRALQSLLTVEVQFRVTAPSESELDSTKLILQNADPSAIKTETAKAIADSDFVFKNFVNLRNVGGVTVEKVQATTAAPASATVLASGGPLDNTANVTWSSGSVGGGGGVGGGAVAMDAGGSMATDTTTTTPWFVGEILRPASSATWSSRRTIASLLFLICWA